MASTSDVMDERTRQALHGAADQASTIALSKEPFDVYKYEADSWLSPGLTRHEATRRVNRQMALEPVSSSSSGTLLFSIGHSNKYSYLRVTFEDDALVSYVLEPATNGKPVD